MTTTSFFTRLALTATTGVAAAALALPAVAAVADTGSAPAAASMPVSSRAVPRFSPLYMGYADNTPITLAMAQQMARDYDVIAAQPKQLQPYVAAMKAINPDLVIAVYVNGMYAKSTSAYPESWFEHDTSGNRIYTFAFGGDLMDPSNAGWRGTVDAACTAAIVSSGYDGCFLDSLGQATFNENYATASPVNQATGQVWGQTAWTAAASQLVQTVINANPGATMLGNGLGSGPHYFDPAGPSAPLVDTASAAMAEVFLRASSFPVSAYPSETSWKANVDMLTDAESRGRSVLTTTKVWQAGATAAQIEGWHRYSLASFLMGTNGGSFFNFSGTQSIAALSAADAEDNVNPGTAMGAYTKTGGLYQRTFSKGLTLVNPTKAAVTIPLAGVYTTLAGATTGGSITMAPNTGDVLTAAASSPDVPAVTLGATASSGSGLALSAVINPTGADTTWTVQYGPTADYGSNTPTASLPAGYGQSPISATLTGLAPGTTYHYTLTATNTNGSTSTPDATVTTPPLAPTLTAGPVGTVTATSADFTATINPGNGATNWSIQYGPTMKYGSSATGGQLPAGLTPVAVAGTINGLKPVTGYHARLVATNSAGTVYGPDRTFKTTPYAPTAATTTATALTATTATLNGTVNPGSGPTTYVFQYGLTTSYGTTTGKTSAGSGSNTATAVAHLSHLLGNTTYHARLVATNSTGTTNGNDITFTTANIAPALTAVTATNITATGAHISATLDPAGQTTTYSVAYGTTTGYGTTTTTNTLTATSTPRTVTLSIGHLTAHTTYHYQITATNNGGTTTTTDRTFTTTN